MKLLSVILVSIGIVLGLIIPRPSSATELSTAAANLTPGSWAQLSNPPTTFFRQQGSVASTLSHLGKGTWDPITRRAYFLGAARFAPSKLHVYDDTSGLWREGGRVPGFPGSWGHGYNHNALDTGSGILGYMRPGPSTLQLYNIPIRQTISITNTWELVSTGQNDGSIVESLAFFPERGTWIVADGTFGHIREYNPDTDNWSVITTKPTCFGTTGTYHTFAMYLPLRGEIAFGGGNSSTTPHRRWCTIDNAGTVVQQPDAPTFLTIPANIGVGVIISVDPVSGDLLVLTQDGKLYAYDFLTEVWGLANDVGRPSVFSNSFNNVVNSVAIPISTYGVNMYGKAVGEEAEIWIYKHSPGSGTPPPPPPPPPTPTLPPSLASPAPGSTLPGSAATFTWEPNNTAVSEWWLYVGSSREGKNFFNSGSIGSGTLSQAVATLPTNGQQVWVRLWWKTGGTWQSEDYTYTAASGGNTPALSTPSPQSTLPGPSATFTWEPNNAAVSEWWLYVGSSQEGKNFFNSGSIGSSTLSQTVATLPTNGQQVWVRLWWKINGTWQSADYTFTAATSP